MKVRLVTDGGSRGNPGKSASAALVFDEGGHLIAREGRCIGTATNNEAEYTALIIGLELCKELGATDVKHHSDSALVVNQMSGKWKAKQKPLIKLNWKAAELEQCFGSVRHQWVGSGNEFVEEADSLVNQCLDMGEGIKWIQPNVAV